MNDSHLYRHAINTGAPVPPFVRHFVTVCPAWSIDGGAAMSGLQRYGHV